MNLKLRAWYNQTMCEVYSCHFRDESSSTFDLLKYDSSSQFEWYYNIYLTDFDLMIALGAIDKNQQIIFNKDIIKHDFSDYENCSVACGDDYPTVTHYGMVDLKVNPCDNGFYITNLIPGNYPEAPFYDQMGQNFVWNELEIIGNVYETVLLKCSHCDKIEFTNPPDMVGTCSVCGEQNLTFIDLSKHKKRVNP